MREPSAGAFFVGQASCQLRVLGETGVAQPCRESTSSFSSPILRPEALVHVPHWLSLDSLLQPPLFYKQQSRINNSSHRTAHKQPKQVETGLTSFPLPEVTHLHPATRRKLILPVGRAHVTPASDRHFTPASPLSRSSAPYRCLEERTRQLCPKTHLFENIVSVPG